MSDLALPDRAHVLFVCEGTFEQYLVETLLNENRLIVASDAVIGVTRTRSAAQIQEQYLNYDYDWPLVILRVLDSRRANFALARLHR